MKKIFGGLLLFLIIGFGVTYFFFPNKLTSIISNTSTTPPKVSKTINNNNNLSQRKKMKTPTSKEQHLVKVQLHRWYQLYEREMNEKRISNQLEILEDDLYMKSAVGEMKGKANYPERLTAYKGWKNAHHVENTVVTNSENGLKLEADIRYQNIRPNGEKKSYTIHYNTLLSKSNTDLPKFSSIEIIPTGETNDTFEDAYSVNRTKSLMYYWLASMENLDGNVAPFKELLADNFILNFSTSSQITSIEGLETWLNGTPMMLKESSHRPENFSVETIKENEYKVSVEFDWKGTAKDGKKMKAKTKHVWHVTDNPNDRFAKILKADVSQIEPLSMIQ